MESCEKPCESEGSDDGYVARCGGICLLKPNCNDQHIIQYTTTDGTVYKEGDCVYLESRSSDTPFYICNLLKFKLDKKDNVIAHVKWYYRVPEVPEQLYSLLLQERDFEWLEYKDKLLNGRGDCLTTASASEAAPPCSASSSSSTSCEARRPPSCSEGGVNGTPTPTLADSAHLLASSSFSATCRQDDTPHPTNECSSTTAAAVAQLEQHLLTSAPPPSASGACSAGGAEASAGVVASPSSVEKWLNEQQFNFSEQEFKERELFSTRQLSFVAAKNLRGHCHVTHFRDICAAASEFDPLPDHFFYILEYNPQSRRLANFKGEVKVGVAYQAVLPELRDAALAENDESREESAFVPDRIHDNDLHVFLNAARSLAATFANMRYGGVEHAKKALSKDIVIIKAIDALHQADYDRDKAIHLLLNDPAPKAPMDHWNSEDKRLFVKGLRQLGKNFNSIRIDYLPHRTTAELVEFYYVWKKTPGAQSSSSFGAATRVQNSRPAAKTASTPKPFSGKKKNNGNNGVARISKILSSQVGNSGTDVESDDSIVDPSESAFSCKHCGTTASKSFVHWGQEKLLLCFECRLDYQKYGRLPKTAEAPSPYLFKPVEAAKTGAPSGTNSVSAAARANSANSLPESPVQSPSTQKKKRKSRSSFDNNAEVYKRAKQKDNTSRSDTPSSESTESNETSSSGRQTTEETASTTPELFEGGEAAVTAASGSFCGGAEITSQVGKTAAAAAEGGVSAAGCTSSSSVDSAISSAASMSSTEAKAVKIKSEPVSMEESSAVACSASSTCEEKEDRQQQTTNSSSDQDSMDQSAAEAAASLSCSSSAVKKEDSKQQQVNGLGLAPPDTQDSSLDKGVSSVKKEPGLHLKMEPMDGGKAVTSSVKDKVESSKLKPMSVEEQMSSAASGESSAAAGVIVIVGRSGLTPPSSPTPVTCSDQVQIPNSRIVAQQSPNKRVFKLVRNWRRGNKRGCSAAASDQETNSTNSTGTALVTNSCARTDIVCQPLFGASFHSKPNSSSSHSNSASTSHNNNSSTTGVHIKKEKNIDSPRIPASPKDGGLVSSASSSSGHLVSSRCLTTPVSQSASGTFGGLVSSASCVSAASHMGMVNSSPVVMSPASSNQAAPHHHSSLSLSRTPSGLRSGLPGGPNIPAAGGGSQLPSPLTVIPPSSHRSAHPGMQHVPRSVAGGSATPVGGGGAGGAPWAEEAAAVERQLRERAAAAGQGDFRLNAELFARLKETANLQQQHPGGGAAGIPTSTAAAMSLHHQLHQSEQHAHAAALTAALLNQQNMGNPPGGALTPNAALSHAAAAAGFNVSGLDPALIMRHLQEEQRIQEHLATQARIAHHLNSAAAVAAAQQQQQQAAPPPVQQQQQQQHHQHSHLHLHMHQQMAVAQAAAAQAALGLPLPPFPATAAGLHQSLQNNSAAAMAAAAAASGLNASSGSNHSAAAAAAAASNEHHAHLAAMLGLPPFGAAAGGAATGNYNNHTSNNILSAMGAAAAAAAQQGC